MDEIINNSKAEEIDIQAKLKQVERENRKLNREITNLKHAIAREKIAYTTILNQQKAGTFIQRERERYLALLLANSPSIIFFLSSKGRVEFCTDYFVKKAGHESATDILGKTLTEVLTPIQNNDEHAILLQLIEHTIEMSQPMTCECMFKFDRDARAMDYSGLLVPMANEAAQKSGIMLMLHDITDLKRSKEDAIFASHAKSAFLSNMSHEIRTPMNAIIGMAKLIMREKSVPANVLEMTATIENSSNHLLNIINDILDFSKIESGKMELLEADYLFHSLINDVVSIINSKHNNPDVQFIAYMENNVPNNMRGDPVRLQQVLLNVLSNAVKYTQKGSVTMDVAWKKTAKGRLELTIRVRDTGIGIKPENLAVLFDEFAQFDAEMNMGIQGTGLGLPITRNLVELMGGTITVESTYGAGSTFTMTFPQEYQESSLSKEVVWETGDMRDGGNLLVTGRTRVDINNSQNEEILFTAPDAKVLIVDDIETNLQVAVGLLKPYGMQADVAISGMAALEALAAKQYDIVFMDHMMPEMDGLEAVKIIRDKEEMDGVEKGICIVALTANAIVGVREMFLANGFDDFLSKPIETKKLNSALIKWIPKEKQIPIEKSDTQERREMPVSVDISNVDVGRGIINSGGSVQAYLSVLNVFRKEVSSRVDGMAECIKNSDFKLYTTYVHALKSACANIGAMMHSRDAAALEAAGSNRDIDFINEHNGIFAERMRRLLADIDATLASSTKKADIGSINMAALNEHLSSLKAALRSFDMTAIDELSEALQEFTHTPKIGDTIEEILKNAFVGKYKQAIELIDGIL